MSTAEVAAATPTPKPARLWTRLNNGDTRYDFVGKRWRGYWVSIVLCTIGIISLAVGGLNLGIDFEGGVSWEVPAAGITTQQVEDVLQAHGLEADRVQTLRGSDGERIRVQVGPQEQDVQNSVREDLAKLGDLEITNVSLNAVGPSWGKEITKKAVRALVVFLVMITLYLSVRLEWRMALAAIIAVVHDVVITVGIYAVMRWEVTPATVIAFLTILGFSLYDTIVVFDKTHENVKRYGASGRLTYSDIVNLSTNEVLMRSINTTLAAVLPVISLLVVGSWMLGAVALEDFSLALLVGLLAGSYSSLFLATPLVARLKEREPRWKAVAARLGATVTPASTTLSGSLAATASGSAAGRRTPAVPSGAAVGGAPAGTPGPGGGTAVIPPRPRKQKRR